MIAATNLLTGPGALRLFLASVVVVEHLSRIRFGVTAVMVFFMLSGYWVSRIYSEKFQSRSRPVWQFYLSRFLRLWPAFAAAVILSIILAKLSGARIDPADLAGLPLLGTATLKHDPLGVSWSLDIEAQFYLLLPLLMLVGVAWGVRGLLITTALALPLGWGLVFGLKIWTALQYLPLFVAGLLIWRQDWRPGPRLACLSLGVFLAAGVALYLWPPTRGLVVDQMMPKRLWHMGAMAWALTLIPFVAWNVRQTTGRSDRVLGDLSYSLYLTHYPVIAAIQALSHGDFGIEIKLLCVLLSAIVALAFWYVIDRPIEIWRAQRFRG